jgi:DNA-binding NtrC family response regulator
MPQESRDGRSSRSHPSLKVLVVDDEATMRDILEMRLKEWGFDVLVASDASEAKEMARGEHPDLVLSDVVMPGMSGVDLLRELKGTDPSRPVILLTAHGTVEMAVEAIKAGARDFLTKPLSYPNLRAVLKEVREERRHLDRSHELAQDPHGGGGLGPFLGTSPQMREVYALIRDLAASDAAVLITGESGTGKELTARTIHELSPRREGPFVALNAAAIPRELVESEIFGHEKGAFTGASRDRAGCFELADRGTLLLDEIAEMPMELQPKLLRVLDEARFRRVGGKREISVDVRTISATNRDPREAVKEGQLREDLYYRLNVLTIQLPALREREGDIPLLAQSFLEEFRRKHRTETRAIREEALELLGKYRWPGNVREIRNVMERAVILARNGWIEPSHLPPYVRDPSGAEEDDIPVPSGITVAEMERRMILKTLDETGNNKAEAARRLNLNVKTIRNKLKSYGIER